MNLLTNPVAGGRLLAALLLALLAGSCRHEVQTPADYYDNDGFAITMEATKSIGHGQYRAGAESGSAVQVPVHVQATSPISTLRITKKVNLQVDPAFGTNGTLMVNATGPTLDYAFGYTPTTAEVDQLVGFTFEATTSSGEQEVGDLTLAVTLSPRDNLPRRRWVLTSIFHVDANQETIADCEKDNYILFETNGTTSTHYGTDTGSGSCALDGLNEYSTYSLSADGQTLTRTYHSVFTPDKDVVETLHVVTLTVSQLVVEQVLDLTVFGLSDHETFRYTYQAAPR